MSLTRFEPWWRERVAGGVVLTAPTGPRAGVIRIRRDQPARPVLAEASDRRRVITNTGEIAELAWLRSGPELRCAAGIDGARFTLFEGESAEDFDRFLEDFEVLVRGFTTGDDPLRRRSFGYRPPEGWRERRLAFSTRWHPPDEGGFIEVFDAIPIDDVAGQRTLALAIDDAGPRAIEVRTCERFRYELHAVALDRQHQAAFTAVVDSVEDLPVPRG